MSMPVISRLFSCVTRKPRHGVHRKTTLVTFNAQVNDTFKTDNIPSQIKDLMVYIAREGVAVTDLFRRPGNPQDMKKIIRLLKEGGTITWTDYNFYTLANVAKRFLLSIEGGILGTEAEEELLHALECEDDEAKIEAMHKVIASLSRPVAQLLSLLFGTWFRMIYHTEVNAMSVEAVAKSVAGSVFLNCTHSPEKVERASKVMEYLITGFASAELFGKELIEYFTNETKTSISRIEKYKYDFQYPDNIPREKSIRLFVRMLLEESAKHNFDLLQHAVSREKFESVPSNPQSQVAQTSEKRTCVTADRPSSDYRNFQKSEGASNSELSSIHSHEDVILRFEDGDQISRSLNFNSVRERQLKSLERRSDWFMSAPSGCQTSRLMRLSHVDAGQRLSSAGVDYSGDSDSLRKLSNSEKDMALESMPSQNLSEVDTRYFMVERYYGPDPPNSLNSGYHKN